MATFDASSLSKGIVLEGVAVADGFAVGRALRLARNERTIAQHLPLREAIEHVRRDLDRVVAALPRAEAELFEPELQILDEIEPKLLAGEADGRSVEEAIFQETSCGCTDLVIDLRERLLSALSGRTDVELKANAAAGEADRILLAEVVTPSTIAFLPKQIVGVIAALQSTSGAPRDVGRASHAAILARGRGVPVAYLTTGTLSSIPAAAWVGLDAAEGHARVWVDPGETFLEAARRRIREERGESLASPLDSFDHLGIALRVNVASAHDEIPRAAHGVGLLRTELMFAGSARPPGEEDQLAAILRVASKVGSAPLVVRLFDAGADKPTVWLGGDAGSKRGIGRLLGYPEILATQLRALARARERADIRVLVPFVETADELQVVRTALPSALPLGAMIESPAAVQAIDSIAASADFISVGTNDLTATTLGLDRSASLPVTDPRVLGLMRLAIRGAHAAGVEVTICGEMVGDDRGARIGVGLLADALSVAPARFAAVRRALGRATVEACREEAERAVQGTP